jgi:hypothetical protein
MVLVCPPDLQPVVVPRKWVNIVVKPEAEPRSLVVLVLDPDVIYSSSMEPSSMETAYTACLHGIGLCLMKMSRNHST